MANPMYTWEPLSPAEAATVRRHFGELGHGRNLVRSKPDLITVNSSFKDHFQRIRNIKVRPDDVWVVTHPKCGTTWTQEMTWHIMNGVDLETAKINLYNRSPFIDMVMIRNHEEADVDKMFADLEALPSPRLIKTHYPFELLPPNLLETCKVLYVCRNVKDAAVSYFHHEKLMKSHDLLCDFETYARELYMTGLVIHGGYFKMLQSGWERRDHQNMMFFWYEEMKEDQENMLRKIAVFLGYSLGEEQIEKLNEHMKFENFQKTSTNNKDNDNWHKGRGQFIRKGIVGDWRNHFSPELNKEYDAWIRRNLDSMGVADPKVRDYFAMDMEL